MSETSDVNVDLALMLFVNNYDKNTIYSLGIILSNFFTSLSSLSR